eukprot:s941_g9.t1
MNALPAQSDKDIDKVRSELLTERKSNLVKLSEKDQIIWRLNKDQEDKRISILGKEGEISMLKAKIQGLEWDLDDKPRQHPNDQSFSAAVQVDPDTQQLIRELRDALEKEKGDHAITRSYYRQVDAAYNEEVREIERLRQGNDDGTGGQAPEPNRPPPEAPSKRGSNERPPDSVGPVLLKDPNRIGHPSDPPPPPEPSTRGSFVDDVTSQSNYSAIDVPRISRREADKVFVPAWPKVQDVVSWQSDVAKGVILAANDGDRAAWQEWLQPALARNPNLDALNDSGGQRFQSIDTKLSIALSNMIQQAGDVARNVSMQLRHRTQAAGRIGGFVMGREILAMVLNHFRTPGVTETMFTMEHIVKMT